MADREEEVAPDRHEWLLHRADGFGVASLTDAAHQLQSMELGHTATLVRRGVTHADPEGRVGVSRVLDGWVVTCAAKPEPAWVGHLRDLLVTSTNTSEREDR